MNTQKLEQVPIDKAGALCPECPDAWQGTDRAAPRFSQGVRLCESCGH